MNKYLMGNRRTFRVFILSGSLLFLFVILWLIGRFFLPEATALILGGVVVLVATCASSMLWLERIEPAPKPIAVVKAEPLETDSGLKTKTNLQLINLLGKLSQARTVEDLAVSLVSDLRQTWQVSFSAFALYSEVDTLIRFDYVKFEGSDEAEPVFRKIAFHNLAKFNQPELVSSEANKRQPAIVMKLTFGEKVRGLLCLGPRNSAENYSAEDLEIVTALSGIITPLICHIFEVEKLEEKNRQLSTEHKLLQVNREELALINRDIITDSEREMHRLAREIQRDPAVKIERLIHSFREKFEKDHYSLNEDEHVAWKLAAEARSSLQAITRQLQPTALGEHGLACFLLGLVEDTMQRVRLVIKLNISPEFDKLRLPSEIEMGLYRVVQAALDNVIDHSRAQHVTISLGLSENRVRVAIVDDGVGFNVPTEIRHEERTRYIGIAGMQERLTALGGKFKIRSTPGAGTVVEAEVPLPPQLPETEADLQIEIIDSRENIRPTPRKPRPTPATPIPQNEGTLAIS